jgi:hypothetical protein
MKGQIMTTLKTPARFMLMQLAADTTVDAYLLQEDDELMNLIEAGFSYEVCLSHVEENY